MLFHRLKASLCFATLAVGLVKADIPVFVDGAGALASGWQDWSWGSTINYAATDLFETKSSMSVKSDAWSALSLTYPDGFANYAGLKFDLAVSTVFLHISVLIQLTI
jgi:hypothetical protein